MRRLLPLLLVLSISSAFSAPGASAAPAFFDGISSDGKVAVFSSSEQILPGDTDQEPDVYVRAFDNVLGEPVTREISVGLRGGNDTLPARYDGMSAAGTEVVFSTAESLVLEDTDQKEDVYLRDLVENETVLVSQGDGSCAAQGCGTGDAAAAFAPRGVADDAGVVFFTTEESLNSLDTDGSGDVYARRIAAEETVLVSAGAASCAAAGCGNGPEGATYWGIDKAGGKAVFRTAESLSSEDGDLKADFYARDLIAGSTELITVEGACPGDLPFGQNCDPSYGGISPDGSHVFFETSERLSLDDTDSAQDVYGWSGGNSAELISIGPDGGNGSSTARYAKTSADGKAVYFLTTEKLDAADKDGEQDVYRNLEGTTTLISVGEEGKGNGPFLASLDWVSLEGSPERAVFSTSEPLVSEDADSEQDVYERSGGVTRLISTGSEPSGPSFNAAFAGAAADGSKIFFVSSERLVTQDIDSSADVYRWSASGTVLVSDSPINPDKEISASPRAVSVDGSKAFFVTQERLTEGDKDSESDVYVWRETEGTLLVSTGNGLSLGPPPPTLEKTVPTSGSPSTTPAIIGQADAGAAVKIYKSSDCTGQVVAQGTAEELAAGLTVTVPVAIGMTTNFSATAEAQGLSSKCSNWISYKQEDAPPPPPPGEEGGGGESGGGTGSTGGTGGSAGGTSGGSRSTGGGTRSSGGGSGGSTRNGTTYVTPVPRITFGPASKTRLRRPTFRFLDSTGQPGTRFFCRVDRRRWAQCTSPIKVRKLKLGRHVFTVKAVNVVGTAGVSPVKRPFKVVR